MKVKIGDTVYDADDTPIMVILNDQDKANIAKLLPECYKYTCAPNTPEYTVEEMVVWMDED